MIDLAVRWFTGDNDAGARMWDPVTGGGYDGLGADGPNLNQGTESTLAWLTIAQHARGLAATVHHDVDVTTVRRDPLRVVPDPSRVITQLYVPGHALPGGREEHASGVVDQILALDDDGVDQALAELIDRFGSRHRDLPRSLTHHAQRISNRLRPGTELSKARWLLLGAMFTHEHSVEAAAVCNPSAVAWPDATATDQLRFVMSVRQIGEGHRSSIGFRTGKLSRDGEVALDSRTAFASTPTIDHEPIAAAAFRILAHGSDDDTEATDWVLDHLGDEFTVDQLDRRLSQLETQRDTRRNVAGTARRLRRLGARTYTATFASTTELSERVLCPSTSAESNGLEDARFVRFVDDDATVTYHATYTAFDGSHIAQQLLSTNDFATFSSSPLVGAAAANKGMALFPRKIHGRYAAMTRQDGATNAVAFSDHLSRWPTASPVTCPTKPWEAIQVGNCGPPIETAEGWLVLTHGVGPMRTYSIGAWLLDLDDPTKLVGHLDTPLLSPERTEMDGYVPNVVYSCGGLTHGSTLLIPFGISDANIGFATLDTEQLLTDLRAN